MSSCAPALERRAGFEAGFRNEGITGAVVEEIDEARGYVDNMSVEVLSRN